MQNVVMRDRSGMGKKYNRKVKSDKTDQPGPQLDLISTLEITLLSQRASYTVILY